MTWAVPRFDHVVTFSGASHQGKVRTSNEDVWRADPGLGLFAVADGMGGHAAGEVAARIAVIAIGNAVRTPEALKLFDQYLEAPTLETRRAVFDLLEAGAAKAHEAVLETAQTDVKRRGMGCTLDAALLLGRHAFLVHAGDGRSYLARPTTTIQLTQDHTIHGTLVARGVMTPSTFPGKSNVLTNAVGRKGTLSVDEVFVELTDGDRLLLCTDGVHGELGDEKVIAELARKGAVDEVATNLVAAALDKGGKDNATTLVIEVGTKRVNRSLSDEGLAARDATFAAHSSLFNGVPDALVKTALRAAIEVEFEVGASVPRFFAGDRAAYIVLEGRIDAPTGWTLGPSSIVYPESLGGGGTKGTDLCTAGERSRAFRIRADDFREVCHADVKLAAMLYERLATTLARATVSK